MLEASTMFWIIWGACGICMYLAYSYGKRAGYTQMHIEIASTIVDIHFEKEKVELMKQELLDIQEATEKLIEDNKKVTQT
jgi:hypothetical protein